MSTTDSLRASGAFRALLETSARLGADPLQVQGPGGNSSLKRDGLMLVKASGTWLSEALARDIMVPVRSGALREALAAGDPLASAAPYVVEADNPGGLRPSIETAVHAALDRPVVLHTHCLATIAVAARADAEAVVARRLGDLGAAFAPYVKPGADLARAIHARAGPRTRVIVLGNHGLVACGEDAAEAEALLTETARRLHRAPARGATAPAEGFATALAGSGWRPAPWPLTQAVAFDPARRAMAEGGTLYPDHLIFLGPGALVARPGEPPADAVARAAAEHPARRLVIVPDAGVAIPADASPSMLALARAFGETLARIEPGVALNRLDAAQEAELLDWDAEKYRQALEAARAPQGGSAES